MTLDQLVPSLFTLVVVFFTHRYLMGVLARLRERLANGEARAFWRGVCAERAAQLDSVAEAHHQQALQACRTHDPSGRGPRGGRGIGSVQEDMAWNNQCEARALRKEARR